MTKSLTEQWKDGELPEDTYYVEFLCGRYRTYEFDRLEGFGFDNDLAYIKEVLEPVPSYEKWKRLQEQLAIATKALKDTKKHIEDFNDDPMNKIGFMAWGTLHECLSVARKALKEMKGVK